MVSPWSSWWRAHSPLDQFIIEHPNYFFDQSPETARINPDNLIILIDHIKCAAFELPFKEGDKFGGIEIEDMLEFLAEERVVHKNGDKWYWMNDAFPAHNISLRSASQENVIIVDQTILGGEGDRGDGSFLGDDPPS